MKDGQVATQYCQIITIEFEPTNFIQRVQTGAGRQIAPVAAHSTIVKIHGCHVMPEELGYLIARLMTRRYPTALFALLKPLFPDFVHGRENDLKGKAS